MQQPNIVELDESNLSEVIQQSLEKLVVLDFWAEWCQPCKSLTPVLEKIVADYGNRVLLAKINADEQQVLAGQFGIRSLPTVKFVAQGQLVHEFNGALPESQIRQYFEQLLGPAANDDQQTAAEAASPASADQNLAAVEGKLAENPSDQKLQAEKAAALAQLERWDEAQTMLDGISEDDARATPDYERAAALLGFSEALGETSRSEARAAAKSQPEDLDARYLAGTAALLDGAHAEALEHFLKIMETDRNWSDDGGKRALVQAFAAIDDDQLKREYRRKMSRLLF